MKRIFNAFVGKLKPGKRAFAVFMLCAMTAIPLLAQNFTTLFRFDDRDGEYPVGTLVQSTDGNLYGTTPRGGATGYGTFFSITPSGTLTTLYNFNGTDSPIPQGGLVQAANGDFYGTSWGGAYNQGTVFKITASGALTTLYNFCARVGCPDGAAPGAGLAQAANGDFYGTTTSGGAYNFGAVFKITPNGKLTTLHSFCSQSGCTDGRLPLARLVQATNGDFYGTTEEGGANDAGTVFEISPDGTLKNLWSLGGTFGEQPTAGVIQGTGGNFYGTTEYGGAYGDGTIFKIASGTLTTLYSFCSQGVYPTCADGSNPEAGLVQGTDGDFYGTTDLAGIYNVGAIFKITAGGELTTLYSFCSSQSWCRDGERPTGGLVQDTNGEFFGTTNSGGVACFTGCGTIFSLSVGLGPFVKAVPHNGQVGQVIRILGTDLTGATAVTFNGAPAAFTIDAPTEITATVPAGATTGTVQVATPTGTLLSPGPFTVLP